MVFFVRFFGNLCGTVRLGLVALALLAVICSLLVVQACTQAKTPSSAAILAKRHAGALERLSGVYSAGGIDLTVLSAMTMDSLEWVAHHYPDLVLAKASMEDELLESGLTQRSKAAGVPELAESRFALIGRIEARRASQGGGGFQGDAAISSDIMIWPPKATERLMSQLQRGLSDVVGMVSSSGLQGELGKVYEAWYGNQAPRYRLVECAPRFNPGEYAVNGDDVVAALLRTFWPQRRGSAAPSPAAASAEQDVVLSSHADTSKSIDRARDCESVFGPKYNKWEFDFLVVRSDGPDGPRYFQEIHARTRMFWAARLFNGPLNGHPELQRTAVFRSQQPLPSQVHLRVFGNIRSPQPFTVYNHKLSDPFDSLTRNRILANYGIRYAEFNARLANYLSERGIAVAEHSGNTVEDLTALFRIARVWDLIGNTRDVALKVGSIVTAAGLLSHGFGELAAYDLTDHLVPSEVGHFVTTAFSSVVVPGAVLTRRAVDTLEIDYLVSIMRSNNNPALKRFISRLQIFDFALAGISLSDTAFFAPENWRALLAAFHTSQVLQAVTEAFSLYRQGSSVSQQIYGPLLTAHALHFRTKRQAIEKLLSEARDSWLQSFNRSFGTDLELVDSVTRLAEQLRNIELYKVSGKGNDEERIAQVNRVIDLIVRNAYCGVLSSPHLGAAIDEDGVADPQALERALSLGGAFGCARDSVPGGGDERPTPGAD